MKISGPPVEKVVKGSSSGGKNVNTQVNEKQYSTVSLVISTNQE